VAFKKLTQDKEPTPMTLTVLVQYTEKAKALPHKLAKLATVYKTVTLFDFLPSDQEDKLALIEEMDLTMGLQTRSFPALDMTNNPIPAISHLIKTIDEVLPKKTNADEIATLKAFKTELQGILTEYDARFQIGRAHV